jgi:hypothetical protein
MQVPVVSLYIVCSESRSAHCISQPVNLRGGRLIRHGHGAVAGAVLVDSEHYCLLSDEDNLWPMSFANEPTSASLSGKGFAWWLVDEQGAEILKS